MPAFKRMQHTCNVLWHVLKIHAIFIQNKVKFLRVKMVKCDNGRQDQNVIVSKCFQNNYWMNSIFFCFDMYISYLLSLIYSTFYTYGYTRFLFTWCWVWLLQIKQIFDQRFRTIIWATNLHFYLQNRSQMISFNFEGITYS